MNELHTADVGVRPEAVEGSGHSPVLPHRSVGMRNKEVSAPKRPIIWRIRRKLMRLLGFFDINTFHQISIEPCFNYCNLRCPYCPVGKGLKLRGMPTGMMSLAVFKSICAKSLKDFTGQILLYNWGEPFLNPELPAIVRHAKKHSMACLCLNSNFSWKYDDRILDILECLENDIIVISCDGYSQKTCEKYRIGVDFDLVMHNVELIIKHKKPQTQLHWQYLRFPWNLDEVNAAAEFCESRQIGFYVSDGGTTPSYPILPAPHALDQSQSRCDFFRAAAINFDGEVYPCCAYYGPPTYSLGNASKTSLQEIFSRGKGKQMLDYLTFQSSGDDSLFCKHCVERNTGLLESWK